MKRLLAGMVSGALLLGAAFAPVKATAQSAEQAPTPVAAQITASSVVLQKNAGYEYSKDGELWWISNALGGLEAGTEYTFYQRLAGQPDTQSQPLKVTTAQKRPCTVEPAEVQVDFCTTDTIYLVLYPDYEYRINGGSWQDFPCFENLQPDTEYTFEQRVKESREELAGEISEPVVIKTRKRGASSYGNYEKVQQYIETNGVEPEGLPKSVGYTMQDELGGDYLFLIYNNGKGVDMELIYDGVEEANIAFDLKFTLHPRNNDMTVDYETVLVADNAILDQVTTSTYLNKQDYNANYQFKVQESGEYLTAENLSQLGGMALELLINFWDEMLYTELGFGLKGMGFTTLEGYGADYCDPASGHHLGTYETAYQREPGCGIGGREGSQYCTVCGERVTLGQHIEPVLDHSYDNECDPDCNSCGAQRCVIHRYSYACAEECELCGAEREEALADHTPGKNGQCIVCAELFRLPGDVNGDGRVNLGDVARVFAHARGKNLLTDPEAMPAADANGDGKINLGDAARILAHVRGKTPLF